MIKSVVVIGGGASGLMAAVAAAENKNKVTVIEKMPRPARKLMITGKGRCNVTNNTGITGLIENTCTNAKFLYSAYNSFSAEDVMNFFENNKLPLKTERGNRVFPISDKAVDVVDCLVRTSKSKGVKFITDTEVSKILTENGSAVGVRLKSGADLFFDKVVLATGGMSYPATGSTGDGYKMADELGHTIVKTRPGLVPFNIHEGFCFELKGLSLKNVCLTVTENGKTVFEKTGEMLFTHFGISGPLVISASSAFIFKNEKSYKVYIDLKPALTTEQLDKRILRDFSENINKELVNSLDKLLPKKLIKTVIFLSKINPHTKVNNLSKAERANLVNTIKKLPLTITGIRDFDEAIITKGGVSVKEINPHTMESKKIKGLYFCGEIIDVDAYTGGYNLQIAFSTGYTAGNNI